MKPVSHRLCLMPRLKGEFSAIPSHGCGRANPCSQCLFEHGKFHNTSLLQAKAACIIQIYRFMKTCMFTVAMEPPQEAQTSHTLHCGTSREAPGTIQSEMEVLQWYLLKTNQTHSTFSGTTDVHEGLSNMCLVWHNLTINPSVLYFIPGLTTQPDIQVTAPLLQTSLALSGPCQHLLPRWGHNKSKQRNASLENSAPARSASLPILFSMDTKAHDMGNTGHLLVCSCEIP